MSITIKVNGLWNHVLSIFKGIICLDTQWNKSKSVDIRPTLGNVMSMKLFFFYRKAVIQLDKKPIRKMKGGGESEICILITWITQRQWKNLHLTKPANIWCNTNN